ncbi:MAG: U32 family peptidase [Planctomycetes bacterium]|nr:U32 family peptidase [Planctomycetota bacterium]
MTRRSRRPEILAPAGSLPALLTALHHGADAVYFGLQDGFNARARAANFSLQELPALVARIHRAGARAYVTLNTLVFEPELPALAAVLQQLAAAAVDALIVQDPAVCLLARATSPDFELHASTQMTICEAAAVPFATGLGCNRVVVPRELSVEEIRQFAAGSDTELEVFVHGALCVSWSGQCLTSEAWGGRSANRGQCAQSCRMPYELVVDGRLRPLPDLAYLLSPKDLAGARAVPELLEVPVHGLKIEGRQKGPHYVATAVAGYRRWVDSLATGGERKAAERQLAQDLLAMSLAYTRGFSDGFLGGSDHQTLVEGRFPKHRGVYLGTVVRLLPGAVVVQPAADGRPWTGAAALAERPAGPAGATSHPLPTAGDPAPLAVRPGMGVVFDQGRPEDPHEPGGAVFTVDGHGEGGLRLGFGNPGPDLSRVRVGDRVFVTSDPALQHGVVDASDAEPTGRHPVDLVVRGALGAPLEVVAQCGALAATVRSTTPLQAARRHGLDAALLADKLGGFGGTPFRLGALDLGQLQPGLHLPPAELKDLRRQVVASLQPRLEQGRVHRLLPGPALPRARQALPTVAPRTGAIALVPLLRSEEQLRAALEAGCQEVELDWMEFTGLGHAVDLARSQGAKVVVATTRVGKPGEQPLLERLRRLEPDGVLLRHFGAVMRWLAWRQEQGGAGPLLHGDFSLNVTNSLTARHLLGLGLDTVAASFDLDETQLLALAAALPAGRLSAIVHHRIPTFHTEHCVYAHTLSNGRDFHSCGRPCERHQLALRDHQGREHPVIVDVGCRNTVFHCEPQQSARWVPGLLRHGVQRFRVEFVREGAAEVARVLLAWRELLAGRLDGEGLATRTGASSQFGVARGGQRLLVE